MKAILKYPGAKIRMPNMRIDDSGYQLRFA